MLSACYRMSLRYLYGLPMGMERSVVEWSGVGWMYCYDLNETGWAWLDWEGRVRCSEVRRGKSMSAGRWVVEGGWYCLWGKRDNNNITDENNTTQHSTALHKTMSRFPLHSSDQFDWTKQSTCVLVSTFSNSIQFNSIASSIALKCATPHITPYITSYGTLFVALFYGRQN